MLQMEEEKGYVAETDGGGMVDRVGILASGLNCELGGWRRWPAVLYSMDLGWTGGHGCDSRQWR